MYGLGSGQGLGEFSAWHAAHSAHSGLPASRMSSHRPAGQTSSQGLGEGLGSGEGLGEFSAWHAAHAAHCAEGDCPPPHVHDTRTGPWLSHQ